MYYIKHTHKVSTILLIQDVYYVGVNGISLKRELLCVCSYLYFLPIIGHVNSIVHCISHSYNGFKLIKITYYSPLKNWKIIYVQTYYCISVVNFFSYLK